MVNQVSVRLLLELLLALELQVAVQKLLFGLIQAWLLLLFGGDEYDLGLWQLHKLSIETISSDISSCITWLVLTIFLILARLLLLNKTSLNKLRLAL